MTERARLVTLAEYVEGEAKASERHEWLNGEVFAMAGGTPEHGEIAANIIRHLGAALRDRPCHVYTSDTRVRVEASGLTTYPDVTVVCGPVRRAGDDPLAVVNPLILVEVTSDSSEDWDRGGKFAHYRRLASLREYIVVSQTERFVEHHVRRESGREDGRGWVLHDVRDREPLRLASIECDLPLDEIYLKVIDASASP